MNSQEAITLLRNLEDALDSYCELNEEGKTAFRMAITALNCSEIPNNWIPCSERLPEEGHEVLLQWKVINTDDDRFFAITHRSDYNYWTGIGREIIPVAWMPLPSLYQPEEKSE